MNLDTRSRLALTEVLASLLAVLWCFIFAKTAIEENRQRTASLLVQYGVKLTFVKPNAFAVFTALYDTPQELVLLEFSRTFRASRHLRLTSRRFGFLKFEPHIFNQFMFFVGKIAVFIGALVELGTFARTLGFIFHFAAPP